MSVTALSIAGSVAGLLAIASPTQAQTTHPSFLSSSAADTKNAALYSTAIHDSVVHAILSAKAREHRGEHMELLPLSTEQMSIPDSRIELAQVSDTLNARMRRDRTSESAEGFRLDSLPIVGDLLDESGNLNMGINLPFDINIDSVMGETGLVFSTDFKVN